MIGGYWCHAYREWLRHSDEVCRAGRYRHLSVWHFIPFGKQNSSLQILLYPETMNHQELWIKWSFEVAHDEQSCHKLSERARCWQIVSSPTLCWWYLCGQLSLQLGELSDNDLENRSYRYLSSGLICFFLAFQAPLEWISGFDVLIWMERNLAFSSHLRSPVARVSHQFYRYCNSLSPRIAKVHVWDMAGQRRFRVCHPTYQGQGIRGGNLICGWVASIAWQPGIAIIYDITDRESFNNVVHWAEESCHQLSVHVMFLAEMRQVIVDLVGVTHLRCCDAGSADQSTWGHCGQSWSQTTFWFSAHTHIQTPTVYVKHDAVWHSHWNCAWQHFILNLKIIVQYLCNIVSRCLITVWVNSGSKASSFCRTSVWCWSATRRIWSIGAWSLFKRRHGCSGNSHSYSFDQLISNECTEASDFAKQNDMFYMETSAKNKQNVEEAFTTLAKEISDHNMSVKNDQQFVSIYK